MSMEQLADSGQSDSGHTQSRILVWLSMPKSRILFLQGLVTVVLSYELLLSQYPIVSLAWGQGLTVGLWLLVCSLWVVPEVKFETTWVPRVFLVADTIATTAVIYLSGNASSHLYVAFFLLMLIAASVRSLKEMLQLSLFLCVGYGVVLYHGIQVMESLSAGHLLGIPVLLVMAVFYGLTLESLSLEREANRDLAERVRGLRFEEEQLLKSRQNLERELLRLREQLQRAEEDLRAGRLEQQGLERRLQQAQKMEAVARLSGVVARDFNQLLRVIGGQAGQMLKKLPVHDPSRGHVQNILMAGDRASVLTGHLRQFSQTEAVTFEAVPLNRAIEDLQRLLRGLLPPAINLRINFDPGVQYVRADQGQLELVIMNLVVNARDAMPQGGQLTIETRRASEPEAILASSKNQVGAIRHSYTVLAVSDTGCGMCAEIEARLFEPFFSTKEQARGTGLATVYGIIQQCGGRIDVQSQPGNGTICKILLPSLSKPEMNSSPTPVTGRNLHGRETVLLVEEDEVWRKVGVAVLRRYQYEVLEARTAVEALLLARESMGSIHVVVCNAIMPDMNGRELGQRLAVIHPDIRTVYLAGYTDDVIFNRRMKGVAFLRKPWSQQELLETVRGILNGEKAKSVRTS